MGKFKYWLAVSVAYLAFFIFVSVIMGIVASVTVIPMYENYHRHGSIFNAPTKE